MDASALRQALPIDKSIPVPLYYQLKHGMKRLIDENIWKPGDQIPTENELTEVLGISRPTVRQALKELINEGYLIRRKPLGTFVHEVHRDGYFFERLTSYENEMHLLGMTPSTVVLRQQVITPDDTVRQMLQLDEQETVLALRRLRYADGETRVVVDTYLPHRLFPGLEHTDLANHSLYETLEQVYHTPVQSVTRTIQAVLSEQQESDLLGIPLGSALCRTTTIAYSTADTPIEYSIAHYRGDNNTFRLQLSKK